MDHTVLEGLAKSVWVPGAIKVTEQWAHCVYQRSDWWCRVIRGN